jgi:hypothetical protein
MRIDRGINEPLGFLRREDWFLCWKASDHRIVSPIRKFSPDGAGQRVERTASAGGTALSGNDHRRNGDHPGERLGFLSRHLGKPARLDALRPAH